MPEPTPLMTATSGLNNRLDPARLRIEDGVAELAEAVNIAIDDSGRPGRRKGYELKVSGNFHSLYPVGLYALCVKDGYLTVLERDYSTTSLWQVNPDARMRYEQESDTVYFLNGYIKGYVKDRTAYPWGGESYVGPTTMKTFSDPPVGHLLALYNGRMYIAEDSIIWYSRPFAYSWYDMARDYFPFESRLRMIKPVKTGMYVSTNADVYYLHGPTPQEMDITKMFSYPAIEGTDCFVNGSKIGEGGPGGLYAIWLTRKGICIGGPDGACRNITRDRLVLPDGNYGAGLVKDNKYISTIEP